MSDVFSFFDDDFPSGNKRKRSSRSSRSSRKSHYSRDGLVVRKSQKALLFFDDTAGYEYWVPWSKIIDWSFANGRKHGLDIRDLEADDEITLVLPAWLLQRERVL